MSLFDELIESLNDKIRIVPLSEKEYVDKLISIFTSGDVNNIYLSDNFKDISFEDLEKLNIKGDFYVIIDNMEIPLFKCDIRSIINNIYDIACLSTRIIILNKEILLYRLFPDDIFRVIQNNI